MRQMPAGQWLAFDVSTEEAHVCGFRHEPDVSIKLKGRNKLEPKENDSIDLGYDEDNEEDEWDDDEWDEWNKWQYDSEDEHNGDEYQDSDDTLDDDEDDESDDDDQVYAALRP